VRSSAIRATFAIGVLASKTHWIFDLDGTLTEAIHDFDAIRAMLGVPPGRGILEWLEAQPDDRKARLHRLLDDHERELAGRATAAAGVAEMLAALERDGCRLGILTRNNTRNVVLTLETAGLDCFFDPAAIITREDARPKPDPDGVLRLVARWGAARDHTVMVGNHHHDLAAGRAAGIATVHVDVSGAFPWPDAADVCVTCFAELGRYRLRASA
jgi:HAD superfamily hydrolase (TIGR01509 family)